MLIKIVANQIITSEIGNEVIANKRISSYICFTKFFNFVSSHKTVYHFFNMTVVWMETCNVDSMHSVEITLPQSPHSPAKTAKTA